MLVMFLFLYSSHTLYLPLSLHQTQIQWCLKPDIKTNQFHFNLHLSTLHLKFNLIYSICQEFEQVHTTNMDFISNQYQEIAQSWTVLQATG